MKILNENGIFHNLNVSRSIARTVPQTRPVSRRSPTPIRKPHTAQSRSSHCEKNDFDRISKINKYKIESNQNAIKSQNRNFIVRAKK